MSNSRSLICCLLLFQLQYVFLEIQSRKFTSKRDGVPLKKKANNIFISPERIATGKTKEEFYYSDKHKSKMIFLKGIEWKHEDKMLRFFISCVIWNLKRKLSDDYNLFHGNPKWNSLLSSWISHFKAWKAGKKRYYDNYLLYHFYIQQQQKHSGEYRNFISFSTFFGRIDAGEKTQKWLERDFMKI